MGLCPFLVSAYLLRRVDILSIDPLVVRVRVPLPLYQILQLATSSLPAFVQDLLNFVFLCAIHQIGRGLCVVLSMDGVS